ncbi:MAG TPA: urease accessory protein UreE [Polyangiaceae bacterium]|nr:urease accessory protein UreE [Polyangiaceae bacterium]
MLTFARRVPAEGDTGTAPASSPAALLTLAYDARQKSRFRARLDDGREAAVLLPRGTVLRDGDVLVAEDGTLARIRAQPELVSVARAPDGIGALRAAYHLGNRHVALQITEQQLVYRHDHVLDAMLRQLGLLVTEERLPFEPEAGAYGHSHERGKGSAGGQLVHEHEHEHERADQENIPTRVELAKPLRAR